MQSTRLSSVIVKSKVSQNTLKKSGNVVLKSRLHLTKNRRRVELFWAGRKRVSGRNALLSLKKQYITNREPNGISKPEASAIKVERERVKLPS